MLYHSGMKTLADIRMANALGLLDEFTRSVLTNPAADVRGVEKLFCEKLGISASYWSQLKGGHRQIGGTLARQFEANMGKVADWLDAPQSKAETASSSNDWTPANADERFVLSMVLTCFRANPEGTKARLLDLLQGELLKASVAKSPLPQPALRRVR